LIPISQNTALFSLLGVQYGGDGKSTFGLPNLAGGFALGQGQGPGLSPYQVGDRGGQAQVTLLGSQVPAHSHALMATAAATGPDPTGAALAPPVNGSPAYHLPGSLVAMAPESVVATGNNQAHENRQPYLNTFFCIALRGIYPARA
jgi:microcystin-dependent protein